MPPVAETVTEATVQQITKNVGDSVAVDETVMLLETDKVVVEVKAPVAGVVREMLVKDGSLVRPKEKLLAIEPGASGAAPAPTPKPTPTSAPTSAPTPTPTAAAPAAAAAASHAEAPHRTPSIKFRYGKREDAPATTHAAPPKAAPAPAPMPESKAGGKTFLDLPAMYGRPRISDEEAEAINSGGAYFGEAPRPAKPAKR